MHATKSRDSPGNIIVDVAGSTTGGAARYRRELEYYMSQWPREDIQLIGRGIQLTSTWLLRRELLGQGSNVKISLNNAGFLNGGGRNITLLGNILQFASKADMDSLHFKPSTRLKVQTPVVRALTNFSDILIAPCTRMAEQVKRTSPNVSEKLRIKFHPVSMPSWAGERAEGRTEILVPIIPQPYKNLDTHVQQLLRATENLYRGQVRIVVPADPESIPTVRSHPRVKFIGHQTSEALEGWWKRAQAVFFPVEFEAFGYALAEGRVYGRSVIAQDTPQNAEISGGALRGYHVEDDVSLRDAVIRAFDEAPEPDGRAFEPKAYFDWLLAL